MKQMDRRLLILMRLRAERPVRAEDLARECECSVRTIYRDVDALSQAGVPLAAMPGEGYRLVPGYHLPPIAFTAEEAVQLLLGSDLALALATPAQREAARAAAAKVEAVLPEGTRAEVERLRERIRVSGWTRHEPSRFLPVLQQAVLEDRALYLQYHSFGSGELTARQVEPYFLTYYADDWHLVGYCRLREAMRDFRASRIQDAEVLPEGFARQRDVEADAVAEDAGFREVRVWLDGSVLPWARETPAFGFEREERSEGGSVFVFQMRELRRLMPWVLSWGPSARVLSPADVAREVRRQAEALASRYAED
ncbi:MAG: YafY family protein [Dehalococcoidia bacterium]|nr:YafY family protein [Dehalococcoidia bacterium]